MDWVLQNQFLILLAVTAVGFFILALLHLSLLRRFRKILGSVPGEETNQGEEIMRRLSSAEAHLNDITPRLDILEKIAVSSIQKVGFLRFNPFHDTGGDQSFVLALLDHDNNGVVISSLYTREGIRLYAKQVEGGMARHQLSEEEQKVLEEAIHKN